MICSRGETATAALPVGFCCVAAALLVAVAAARFIVYRFEDVIRANPALQPPEWQIRRQASQMAEPVVADDYLGFRQVADQDVVVRTLDFTFRRVTGVDGFPVAGPWPDRADVVFLGDSLLLGEGVGIQHGFAAGIDQRLGDQVVVNLGNPGAGLERQYRIFERYGVQLKPRLLVAFLYLAADLDNDTHFQAWLDNPMGMSYNEFRVTYRRRMDPRSKQDLGRRLEAHPLFSWAQSFVEPLLWGEHRIAHRVTLADGSTLFLDREKVLFARRSYSGEEPEFQRLLDAVGRLSALARSHSIALGIVLIPSKEEVYGVAAGSDTVDAPRRFMLRLTEAGIPCLDLAATLRQRARNSPAYFPRDIHLNDLGNQIVAEAVTQWVVHESTFGIEAEYR